MTFAPPLIPVRFLRRYQRFFADVEFADGSVAAVHVPNSGRMTGCLGEGWPALVSDSGNPARRLHHTLELTHNGATWIGVQTLRANGLAREALEAGLLPGLGPGWSWLAEVRRGESRLDFLGLGPPDRSRTRTRSRTRVELSEPDDGLEYEYEYEGMGAGERLWVEVKSVTLRLPDGLAGFPDAVTTRGLKHLRELRACRAAGERALLLLVVQREDVQAFRPADEVDPAWAAELRLAVAEGVELAALQIALCPTELRPVGLLPVELS